MPPMLGSGSWSALASTKRRLGHLHPLVRASPLSPSQCLPAACFSSASHSSSKTRSCFCFIFFLCGYEWYWSSEHFLCVCGRFDVQGFVNGLGSPEWRRMHLHEAAEKTAVVAYSLLKNGDTCVGNHGWVCRWVKGCLTLYFFYIKDCYFHAIIRYIYIHTHTQITNPCIYVQITCTTVTFFFHFRHTLCEHSYKEIYVNLLIICLEMNFLWMFLTFVLEAVI